MTSQSKRDSLKCSQSCDTHFMTMGCRFYGYIYNPVGLQSR